jgi:predicted dehydrogenase
MNESTPTRRDFLRASAVLPAALPFVSGAYAAGSDTIRVGVIGCGGRGHAAAMNAMNADPGVRIVAMGDLLMERVIEKRADLQSKYKDQVTVPNDRCFDGWDAYRHVIEASDVVIIANAAKFHSYYAKCALEAGRHVFVEKPHAIDPLGIHTLEAAVEIAKTKKLSLVSGLQSRYHPGYRETMQRIHDGAIGDIVAIQETWLRPPYVLYPRKAGMRELTYQGSNQYHFHWLCGDDVPQTLIHNLDRASWAQHNAAPIWAQGMGGRSTLHGEIYGSVFDHNSVVYEFPGGVRVYAMCRTIDHCYEDNSSLILGTKGRCDLLQLRITGETNWQSQAPKSKRDAYDLEHVALFQGIRSGQPVNSGDYMVRSTMIGILGQLCSYTGQKITWEQANASRFFYSVRPEEVNDGLKPPVVPGPDGTYPVLVPGQTQLL